MWTFPEIGVPPNHQFYVRIFHEINHPASGVTPWLRKPPCSDVKHINTSFDLFVFLSRAPRGWYWSAIRMAEGPILDIPLAMDQSWYISWDGPWNIDSILMYIVDFMDSPPPEAKNLDLCLIVKSQKHLQGSSGNTLNDSNLRFQC